MTPLSQEFLFVASRVSFDQVLKLGEIQRDCLLLSLHQLKKRIWSKLQQMSKTRRPVDYNLKPPLSTKPVRAAENTELDAVPPALPERNRIIKQSASHSVGHI